MSEPKLERAVGDLETRLRVNPELIVLAVEARHLRTVLAALAQAQAAVRECEAEHPPEPEYVAWCEAGKPDGVGLAQAQEQLRAAEEKAEKQQDLIVALEALLVAYRLGSHSRADAALTKVEKARAALEPKR